MDHDNAIVEGALAKGTTDLDGGTTNHPSSRAYVTFLAGDGDYVKGVVGLAKGLRKVKSAYPLVVATLPDVPENHRARLTNHGCIIREIEVVYPPDHQNDTQFAREDFGVNYSKLRLWKLVEYSKMIYLDADVQVYGNIDHLFDLPDGSFCAAPDSFCETPCQRCPDKVSWPEELEPKPSLYFNAGMFVFEPSLCTYDQLLEALKVIPRTQFAEQDFLNVFFRDICQPLPPLYNLLLVMWWRHPEKVELDDKVLHYCASDLKPWRFTAEEIENLTCEDMKMLIKRWWEIYNDESLDSRNDLFTDSVHSKAEDKHFLPAFSEVGVVHYIANPSAA